MENTERGPWEDYQTAPAERGPWEDYQRPGFFNITSADRRRIRESFVNDDPLGFIANEDQKFYIRDVTETLPDRDEYRKRLALAAYFTAHNKGADYRFVLGNLDSVLEQFYKKKTSVDAAFADIAQMYNPPRTTTSAEFGKMAAEGAKSYAAAAGAGLVDFAQNAAATWLKLGVWGTDMAGKILSPVLTEEQKKLYAAAGKLGREVGAKWVIKGNREIAQGLSETSGANENFLTDLITGDFDKVSVHDFTKALIRSAPNMAFQLGLAAVAPWAAPAFIGTQTAAMKDYEVDEKQPEWGEAKRLSYIGLSAVSEALLETVTGKIVKGEMTREAAAKIIQKGLWKYIGKSFGKEAGTEAAQQLSANSLDLLYDIEGDYNRLSGTQVAGRLFNGVLESGFIGGVWGVPYGAAGFRNTRKMMGAVEQTRAKHKARVKTLAQKENLSAAEKAQLQTSQEILDNNSPQEVLALDHISQKVDEANTEAEIRESEEYKKALEESAPGTTEEEVIAAVRAERNLAFRATAEYDFGEVYGRVAEIAADFPGVEFVTLDSWKHLPDDLRTVVGNRGRAFYNPDDGKVYLNASRLRPHEVLEVMLHEAVGHKGLRAVVPQKQLNEMLDKVYNAHFNDDDFQQLAARYFPETLQKLTDENGDEYVGPLLETVEQQREAAEEYIAHIAQKGVPKPNWWKEFLQQIRMFFRRFKWAEDAVLLDSQIETVLARAARKVRKGVVKENLTTGEGLRFSETDGNVEKRAAAVIVPPLPVDITDTASVRNYLYEHFKGKEVEIKSDGRPVLFAPGGLKSTLKRRGKHRNSFSALDAIVEESYPVGYELVDDRHKAKRPDLRGQFVYAALLDFGQEEKYIATIKLDDTASDKRALFKDISIKKGSLYAGQTQNSTSVNATLPADPNITIQQLVDFVKSDFSDSPLFADKMPKKSNLLFSVTDDYGQIRTETDLPDVSDKLRFSLEEYSESEQEDITAVLRPFVGRNIDMDPEKYRGYLKEKGILIPDKDADTFFRMAVRENDQAARARANKIRDQWIFENFPIFAEVAEFAGGSDFKIKPVGHEGEDFTGSFISPAYVKYSVKASQGKRSEKQYRKYLADRKERLAAADGLAIDEVAEAVARKLGQDSDRVKEQILDFFRHLKKKELYSQYSQFKKDALALDKEAERQAREEFMQQEKFRIEDEAVQILTAGEPITPEWIAENPKVFKEVYTRIFNGKDAPATPSNIDIEAVNAALTQDQSTESFGPGYKEGKRAAEKEFRERLKAEREKAYEEYMEKLRQIRDQVVSDRANAVKLQRDAADFAAQHLPKENRAEFVKAIAKLLELSPRPTAKFPEGQRKAAFDKLLARITERAAEVRKGFYLDKIAKRLQQLGERVDSGRKVRGMRDVSIQEKLNRIIQISRLDGASLNAAITADQQQIENLIAQGESTADLEYDIALLNRYGELWNKSADEVKTAFDELQLLAKTGKDNLLTQINSRAAADENDRNELWLAINGGKKYSSTELLKMKNSRSKMADVRKLFDKSYWTTLSLDGMFEALALFSDKENVVDRFRRMAHKAKLDKDTLNMRNAEDCREFLKQLLKTDSRFAVAEAIGNWRKLEQNSGVRRFVPDPREQQFKYERIPVEEARRLLALYDSGRNNMPDYEAEAIRQQLSGLDRKIKYEVPEEFRDGATDKLIELIRKDMDEKDPAVVIPHPTFKGTSEELPLSQLQALFLKLMWDQKDIRYKMHYNGYSDETMRQVDAFLLPEVKEFGNWMRKQLELDRTGIERVFKEMYFANFPKEENYFPAVYAVTGNQVKSSTVDLTEEGAAAGAVAYTPGALKVRVYHLKDLDIADALTVFQNHRLQMNHFVTHAETARKMRSVLLNNNVKQAIEGVHGKVAYQEMKLALKDFINGGNADVLTNDWGAHIYAAAVRSKMAFNLVSGLKQTMGSLTYLQEIPARALSKGIAYAATHPKEVIDTLADTEYFKTRWNSGANADMRLILDAAGKQGSKAAQFFKSLDEVGSLPLRFGDAASVLFGGFAVYKYHYDNLVKQGLSEKEARKEALLKWEMATERTQQSSSPFLLNRFQRGGYMARTFTTFMSNQILLWNHNSAAVYKALVYGDKAPLKDLRIGLTALLISSAAMTAFDQIKDHWNDGEYEWMNLFWNSLSDMITGFGPAGSVASTAIQAVKPSGFPASPIWSDVIYSGYAVKRQIFNEEARISDNDWGDAVRILQGAGYFYEPAAQAGAIAREARKWYRIFTE